MKQRRTQRAGTGVRGTYEGLRRRKSDGKDKRLAPNLVKDDHDRSRNYRSTHRIRMIKK